MQKKHILFVFGTRPEAIKLAPLITAAQECPTLATTVVNSGQHSDMLDSVITLFKLPVTLNLEVAAPNQPLPELASKIFTRFTTAVSEFKPDTIVVHGDTVTASIAALVGFYSNIPVVHLEAGLRTGDRTSPYPEEVNRRIISMCSSLHLAPTVESRKNLLDEGFDESSVCVVGNTVIDALLATVQKDPILLTDDLLIEDHLNGRQPILVTMHRRENLGQRMVSMVTAVAELAGEFRDYLFVLPMHKNPLVREIVISHLSEIENILLCEPQGYSSFAHLMARSTLIMTDSGGIQEEAPALNVPVLVMRDTTERPEGVRTGAIRLVGASRDSIVKETRRLLKDEKQLSLMKAANNPFGDGTSSTKALAEIKKMLSNQITLTP